ncbi:MAG: NAD(P)H-dependent amine dehydrogenase family protein [Thermoanaerobaculia bacterium]
MHPHQQPITIAQYGIGPIGAEIARILLTKPWAKVVAAVDVDPSKIGRDLGEVIGLERETGIKVAGSLSRKVDVICHATASSLREVEPQIRGFLEAGFHVVSTCEELAYPLDTALRESLQKLARANNVTLIGTGVSPGFVLDKLPLTLSAVCQDLTAIAVVRIIDLAAHREPLQRKAGLGMTPAEFAAAVKEGNIRPTGLRESLMMIANGLGIELDAIGNPVVEPILATKKMKTEFVQVRTGNVCGLRERIEAEKQGRIHIALEVRMSIGAKDPHDEIRITGTPDVTMIIPGGIHGDRAAAAMAVNMIPRAVNSRHGLLTMDDLAISYR